MKRIVIHWTAGTHKASSLDKRHYHFIVEGDGNVVQGDKLPEANLNTADGDYAAHVRAANTGSIGVSFAAMHGAKERPFSAGEYPITEEQIDAMAGLCANLCESYGIEVARRTVLTHAEVQPTLGIKQRGKWDIMWLPGMEGPADPVIVGDRLRARIVEKSGPASVPIQTTGGLPKEVADVMADADKSPAASTTNWGAALALLASGYQWWQSQDAYSQAMSGAVVLLMIWIMRERIRKAKIGKLAKEALGL